MQGDQQDEVHCEEKKCCKTNDEGHERHDERFEFEPEERFENKSEAIFPNEQRDRNPEHKGGACGAMLQDKWLIGKDRISALPVSRQVTEVYKLLAPVTVTIKQATNERARGVNRAEVRRLVEERASVILPRVEQIAV
jgi:hypothetical protein